MKYIKNFLLLFCIFFLLLSVIEKLINYNSFVLSIENTQIFYNWLILPLSYFVIIMEISTVITLIIKEKIGFLFLSIIFLIFSIYIIILNHFDKYSSCGCGGLLNYLGYTRHLIFNTSICILSFFSYLKLYQNEK
ncbi:MULTISPECIES: MauE/DoxX family redox-associated membrane protein [unclassified Myroides]